MRGNTLTRIFSLGGILQYSLKLLVVLVHLSYVRKKTPPRHSDYQFTAHPCSHGLRKELEQLHARRMAIATLIESLEDYDRFRVRRFGDRRLRTA